MNHHSSPGSGHYDAIINGLAGLSNWHLPSFGGGPHEWTFCRKSISLGGWYVLSFTGPRSKLVLEIQSGGKKQLGQLWNNKLALRSWDPGPGEVSILSFSTWIPEPLDIYPIALMICLGSGIRLRIVQWFSNLSMHQSHLKCLEFLIQEVRTGNKNLPF